MDSGVGVAVMWLPEIFVLYTAEEATRYRESRPADVPEKRRVLAAELRAAGVNIR